MEETQDLHDGGSEDVEVRCHARVSTGRVPGERCLHTCTLLVQDGSRVVYLYAGRGKSGALDDLHQLDLEGNVWTQPKVTGPSPSPCHGPSPSPSPSYRPNPNLNPDLNPEPDSDQGDEREACGPLRSLGRGAW